MLLQRCLTAAVFALARFLGFYVLLLLIVMSQLGDPQKMVWASGATLAGIAISGVLLLALALLRRMRRRT
jgi:hypothetical protein